MWNVGVLRFDYYKKVSAFSDIKARKIGIPVITFTDSEIASNTKFGPFSDINARYKGHYINKSQNLLQLPRDGPAPESFH